MTATETKFNKLQDDINKVLCAESAESSKSSALSSIVQELAQLKAKVLEDRDMYSIMVENFAKTICHHVKNVDELKRKETEERYRKESESDLEQIRETLELESHKLEDCHREIEVYRQQLEHYTREVDRLKADSIDEKETFERALNKELEEKQKQNEEAIKKLMLEHEVELESVRQELETSDKVVSYQEEIARLTKRLQENDKLMDDLRKKKRILEMTQEEKFQNEKDRIVQILEAGFSQREKFAVQQAEEDLQAKHAKEFEGFLKEKDTKMLNEQDALR